MVRRHVIYAKIDRHLWNPIVIDSGSCCRPSPYSHVRPPCVSEWRRGQARLLGSEAAYTSRTSTFVHNHHECNVHQEATSCNVRYRETRMSGRGPTFSQVVTGRAPRGGRKCVSLQVAGVLVATTLHVAGDRLWHGMMMVNVNQPLCVGCGMMDWMRTTRETKDLAGRRGRPIQV